MAITTLFLLAVLLIQLKATKFRHAFYWLVIVGTAVVGAEISDLMDRTLGLGYSLGSQEIIFDKFFMNKINHQKIRNYKYLLLALYTQTKINYKI